MKKILFTSQSDNLKSKVESLGFELVEQRFIERKSIPFNRDFHDFNWIFFSSREAVHSFFKSQRSIGECKLAAVGKGTAEAISEYGKASFVGKSTDTAQVGLEFAELIGDDRVIFPISTLSRQTIQKHLKPEQYENFLCYETGLFDVQVETPTIAIFSSPSNVDGYLISNSLDGIEKIIVFGPTTADHIKSFGRNADIILSQVNESSIVDAIKKAIAGL